MIIRSVLAMSRVMLCCAFCALAAPMANAQMCTEDFCEIPTDDVQVVREEKVAAIAHGYMGAGEFVGFLMGTRGGARESGQAKTPDGARESGQAKTPDGARESGQNTSESGRGFAWRLALAFLAGLLLNLSPCVLPLLPIQVAVLGMGANARSRRAGALRGAVYGLAMAVAYGALGFAVARSGAAFGSLQSMRPFNAAIAVLFLALGLAMLGVFHIDFTGHRRRIGGALSWVGLAAAGATAALLAGACVAPAVLGARLYAAEAYAAGHAAALALPFVLGLGMASPWPFIGAGLSFLPKPGKWMVAVKWVFAVIAFALAAHYGRIALAPRDGTTSKGAIDYRDFDAAYAEATATGKPVVIDFFASWCGSCTRMEEDTFPKPEVVKALADYVFLRVQVEDPFTDEAVALLARFGVRGFPAIVVIGR